MGAKMRYFRGVKTSILGGKKRGVKRAKIGAFWPF
jgi:hypothetical protein